MSPLDQVGIGVFRYPVQSQAKVPDRVGECHGPSCTPARLHEMGERPFEVLGCDEMPGDVSCLIGLGDLEMRGDLAVQSAPGLEQHRLVGGVLEERMAELESAGRVAALDEHAFSEQPRDDRRQVLSSDQCGDRLPAKLRPQDR